MARETGLSKRTIRYYEEIGVLPTPERTSGGYRDYDQSHLDRLKQVVLVRDILGFTLQQVQEYLSLSEGADAVIAALPGLGEPERKARLEELKDLVERRAELIGTQIAKAQRVLSETRALLGRVVSALDRYSQEPS